MSSTTTGLSELRTLPVQCLRDRAASTRSMVGIAKRTPLHSAHRQRYARGRCVLLSEIRHDRVQLIITRG